MDDLADGFVRVFSFRHNTQSSSSPAGLGEDEEEVGERVTQDKDSDKYPLIQVTPFNSLSARDESFF